MPSYVSPFGGLDTLGKQFFESNPASAYQKWTGAYGATPQKNPQYYAYGDSLKNYFQEDYYGESARDPGLTWLGYLDNLGNSNKGLGSMWEGMAPSQRGERQGQFAPPVKWVS